jgi:hypothetical protein
MQQNRASVKFGYYDFLGFLDPQALGHFLVQEPFSLPVGLHPFAVNDELRDGSLARPLDHFVGGAGRAFDIDLVEGDVVLFEKALGFAAVRAPKGGVNSHFHRGM